MKLINLTATNYRCYAKLDIDFTKLGNVIAITGKRDNSTKSSNAVGKTAFVNLIQYILYDYTAGPKEKIIRDGTSKCEASIVFKKSDGSIYKVERYRTKSSNGVKLYQKIGDDFVLADSRTSEQTNESIRKVIGVGRKNFENTFYFKQNDRFNLITLTPAKRNELIAEMLVLNEWDKYYKKAQKQRDVFYKEVNELSGSISSIGDPQADIIESQKQLKDIDKSLSATVKEITTTTELLDAKKRELIEIEAANSEDNLTDLKTKITKETAYVDKLTTEVSKLETSLVRKQTEKTAYEVENKKLTTQLDTLNKQLEEANSSKCEPVDDKNLNKLLTESSKLTAQIRQSSSSLSVLSKELPEDEACPSCGNDLDEKERTRLLKIKQDKIASLKKEIANLKEELSTIDANIKKLTKAKQDYETFTKNLTIITSSIEEKQRRIKLVIETIAACVEAIESIEVDIRSKKVALTSAKENLKSLSKDLNDRTKVDNSAHIAKLKLEKTKLENELKAAQAKVNTLTYSKGQHGTIITSRNRDLTKLNDLIDKKKATNHNYNVYKCGAEVFSKAPEQISATILESLQTETNTVLQILRNYIQLQFVIEKDVKDVKQSTLEIKFFKHGKECTEDELSGGELGCVVLATRFAMANVNRTRCGADIDLFMLDEVEHDLDQNGLESFFDLLNGMGITALVITHNLNLQEKFNSFLIVHEQNGVSTIEAK